MAQSFVVVATHPEVTLRGEPLKNRAGKSIFIVTNRSTRNLTGRVKVIPFEKTSLEWFSIAPESEERNYNSNESFNVEVNISVPPEVIEGSYKFRLDAFSEQHPQEDYTEGQTVEIKVEQSTPPPKKPKWWLYAIIAGAVLLILIVILLLTCQNGVRVPDVTGMPYREAEQQLNNFGLEDSLIQQNLPSDTNAWIVFAQDPAANANVDKNTTIRLTIGMKVPSVVGETEAAGRNSLSQAGFEPVKSGERDTGQVPGRIVESQPAADELAEVGSQVQYWVRTGPVVNEDCIGFRNDRLEIRQEGSQFLLTDGRSRMKMFPSRALAERGVAILRHYDMNSQCFVGRPDPSVEYWLTDQTSPQGSFAGEDCLQFDPNNLSIFAISGRGTFLIDGSQTILRFPNRSEAELTRDIIRKHGFTHLCFVGTRSDPAMTYFRR